MNTFTCIALLMCLGMAYAASVPLPELQQVEVVQAIESAGDETLQPEESRHGGHHGHHHGGHWGHHGGHHWGHNGGHHWGHYPRGHYWHG
ncbi:histidine-rich glycoprotein-like [Achroia grisella]|uniref:histidine-rich glycoprotein-like n=1 Tax=Achroia grisella TaxID=688607 RepID=UPI0027D34EDB|nr:histidine-rich glycoprotein-like [Achroia grisella]